MAKKQLRVAIFSDIHGNLMGLEACLADLQAQGWESLGTHGCYYWAHRLRRPVTAQADVTSG